MNTKRIVALLALSGSVLVTSSAFAGDAVVGALFGGGLGAIIGQSVGGRDGAIVGGALGAAVGASSAHNRYYGETGYYGGSDYYGGSGYYGGYGGAPAVVYAPAPRVIYSAPSVVYRAPPRVVYGGPVVVQGSRHGGNYRHWDRYQRGDHRGDRYEGRYPRHERGGYR